MTNCASFPTPLVVSTQLEEESVDKAHGGNDDDGDDDGDGSSGGAGPKTWDTATLSQREKKALESFPAPTRKRATPSR